MISAIGCGVLLAPVAACAQTSAPGSSAATAQAAPTPAQAERQQRMLADAAKMVELAQALKANVDKTGKDELNVQVIREAEQLEALARQVKAGLGNGVGKK